MKKLIVSLLVVVFGFGCAGKPTSTSNVADFKGKDWKLVEVWIDGKNSNFSRKDLTDKTGDIFTLKLDGENISGTGAPNRYSAPYTLSGKQNISLKLIRSTMMASLLQPDKLKENDFFTYMQNINEWAIVNGRLEFSSKLEDGRKVKLVFSL
jgi:heat shock protein HslJ